MVTLDQVEKLREKANVSYDEAKAALEESNGDMLEAIISLERQNLIKSPEGGGYFNSRQAARKKRRVNSYADENDGYYSDRGSSFKELLTKIIRWAKKMIGKGNRNYFEVTRGSERTISIPVTILVLALFFAFWIVVPLIVVGLFFGYRFSFSGPDLASDTINRAMDSVCNAAENLKNEVKGDDFDEEDSNS